MVLRILAQRLQGAMVLQRTKHQLEQAHHQNLILDLLVLHQVKAKAAMEVAAEAEHLQRVLTVEAGQDQRNLFSAKKKGTKY